VAEAEDRGEAGGEPGVERENVTSEPILEVAEAEDRGEAGGEPGVERENVTNDPILGSPWAGVEGGETVVDSSSYRGEVVLVEIGAGIMPIGSGEARPVAFANAIDMRGPPAAAN
jgi:hypothetical protein